ncbi:hypothetical protein J6590_022404 [Homalodisca vitripennis]|nr:hypothetical protein J6590_022404 [Homalodisca vitripennis]
MPRSPHSSCKVQQNRRAQCCAFAYRFGKVTTYTGTTTGPPRPLRPNNTRLSRSRYINGFSIYPIWLCNRHLSTFAPLNAAPFGQSVLLDSRTRLRNSDCCSLGTECVSVSL